MFFFTGVAVNGVRGRLVVGEGTLGGIFSAPTIGGSTSIVPVFFHYSISHSSLVPFNKLFISSLRTSALGAPFVSFF